MLKQLIAALRKTDPTETIPSEPDVAPTPTSDPVILRRLDEIVALLVELVIIEQVKSKRSGIEGYR